VKSASGTETRDGAVKLVEFKLSSAVFFSEAVSEGEEEFKTSPLSSALFPPRRGTEDISNVSSNCSNSLAPVNGPLGDDKAFETAAAGPLLSLFSLIDAFLSTSASFDAEAGEWASAPDSAAVGRKYL
jgi:hypothetical protein